MALIKCSECGRTVSDKAKLCVGCGAPLQHDAEIRRTPLPARAPPPTRSQLLRRTAVCAALFVIGVIWSSLSRAPGGSGAASIAAALLVIVGLCGVIIGAVQWYTSRKQ